MSGSPLPVAPTNETGITAEILLDRYREVRGRTESLCEPLQPEDYVLQAMADASPTKWHLAHTTWFFETFVLADAVAGYHHAREDANFLFNSYYNAVGERIARDRRGMLSRPSIEEVRRYRSEVDRRMEEWLGSDSRDALERLAPVVVLGLNHEQQHQELILTDLKVAFGMNPVRPVYREDAAGGPSREAARLRWIEGPGGVLSIGSDGGGFRFDNEGPRHRTYLEPFEIASRPATVGEYLAFLDDNGYRRPEFWLSDGWAARTAAGWEAPMYWEKTGTGWSSFTLGGMRRLVESDPVVHLSFYEADAFARWSGARLPTEAEWEVVAADRPVVGNLLEMDRFHPTAAPDDPSGGPVGLFGDVWEWTASPYIAYPGYRPASGALGEYNGKFMCNQIVLRGGSCATPADHVRATYRNFFPPGARWQFSGVRLAR